MPSVKAPLVGAAKATSIDWVRIALVGGVDFGEADIFGHQTLLLDELPRLQHGAEADAEAARPISDLDLLLRARARCAAADRGCERKGQAAGDHACDHVCVSCDGSASSEARNSAVSATAPGVPIRGLRQRNIDRAADAARPRRHHHDVIGEDHRLLHVVRDEQNRHRTHGVNAKELAVHAAAGLRIEPRERLVHQQDLRLADKAARERDAAAHAAGQLVRIGLLEPAEPDQIEHRARAPQAFGRRHGARFERERDVPDRHPPRQQAIVLEHVADVAPVHRGVGPLPHHDHPAGVGKDETRGHVEKRGLARTGRTENGDDATDAHIETDVAQNLETAAIGRRKMFGNILKRDGRTAATIRHPRQHRLGEIDVGFARHCR